jgi:hypothetical protein
MRGFLLIIASGEKPPFLRVVLLKQEDFFVTSDRT